MGKSKPAKRDFVMLSRVGKSMGLTEVRDIISEAGDPKFTTLLEAMYMPEYRNFTLGALCARFGLKYHDVADAIRRHYIDLGLVKMAKHVPQVLEDVAIDSKTREVTCEQCEGVGKVTVPGTRTSVVNGEEIKIVAPVEKKCFKCNGTGNIRISGDKEARKLFFDAMGLIPKGALIDARSQHVHVDSVEDTLRDALGSGQVKVLTGEVSK